MGYDAWVVVLPSARVADLVTACPSPADEAATHTCLTLASGPDVLAELHEAGRALAGSELTLLGPGPVAWLAPAGGTLDSPFRKLSARPKYKAATTTRDLRTMVKVRDAAASL